MKSDDETVILVDEADREVGLAPKLVAHQSGWRHRAISVCIVDGADRMLLQRRALGKYHSGGLWTNACCTHPRPGERADHTARRRLQEELGITCLSVSSTGFTTARRLGAASSRTRSFICSSETTTARRAPTRRRSPRSRGGPTMRLSPTSGRDPTRTPIGSGIIWSSSAGSFSGRPFRRPELRQVHAERRKAGLPCELLR